MLGFHLVISNPTDRQSSLVKAELRLTYSVDSVVTTLKVPLAVFDGTGRPPRGVEPVSTPVRLEASDAMAGWFLFCCEEGLTGGAPVDRYDVVVRDIHGVEDSAQVTIFREADHDGAS